jgi:hypothetical protein
MSDSESSSFGPVIFSYSRAQALEDQLLWDFTTLAREAGFRVPLAVTEAVYKEYLDPSQTLVDEGQSLNGRAWNLLQVLHFAAAVSPDRDTVYFKVLFVLTPGCPPEPVELKATCGPGDEGEPVLTVLMPNED